MNRGIEKDAGDLLGNGMEAKVISMLWVKMWDIKRHLGKWKSRLCGGIRGLAAYGSSVSFGHPEHCFVTVWTPKYFCQNLLMMFFLRR